MPYMAKLVINPKTLLYELQDEHRGLKVVRIVCLAVLAPGLAALYFWLYTSVLGLDLPKTAYLKKQNARWQARVELLNRQMDVYDQTLSGIEDRNDEVYRSIYGLGNIPDEVKNAGFGGVNRYEYLDRFGANSELKATVRRMDRLTKRIYVQSKALDEVGVIAHDAGDMLSCVPSVPPICPNPKDYHLSSPFGYRTDPVYGGGEFHKGQDIASFRGNPVYATGDGVVETADFHFGGYGNEIVIDHGYGYKSHYAHLNTIDVVVGMKVRRGDFIGTLGSSGKSTGPHLHYEILYRNVLVDPMNFMDFSMPVDEYMAMVEERKAENTLGRTSSTSEILERRR